MFCPKCGSQIADDAAFCVNCGHAVNSQHAQAPQTQQPVQSYPPVDPQAQQLPMKWFKFLIYFLSAKARSSQIAPMSIAL